MEQKFAEVLQAERINKVIYVDDAFDIDKYKVNVQALFEERGEEIGYPEGWKEGVTVEQQFNSWWESAPATRIMDIVNRFNVQSDTFSVSTIIPKGKLQMLTPEQFKDTYTTEVIGQFNHDNKLLLLMDRELGDDERKGDELLEDYLGNPSIYCTIFSETFNENDELKMWRENNFQDGIYPLAKSRQDNAEKFIKGLRNVLWMRHIFDMRSKMDENLKKATEEVVNQTKSLDPYAFDNAVMASSYKEGCWEYDTLLRMYLIQLDTELRKITKTQFNEVQQEIASLRTINDISKEDGKTSEYLKKLREDEVFIDGDYLNTTFAPIDNGDIFKIGEDEYILLAQPCNLALRKTGTRTANMAFLLKLEKENVSSKIKKDKFREYLNFQDGVSRSSVLLSKAIPVALSVFDLTSFNDKGEAKIDCIKSSKISELCQPNLAKRFEDVKKEFKSILAVCNKTYDKEVIRKIVETSLGGVFFQTPNIVGNTISFDIKRTKRYRSLYAQVLLQQLNGYLSRAGFPSDFSEPVKAED